MRKYRHTALVILCLLTSVASGQFSEIWTNGDLFAVNEMASQCYSASVERCQAAGVTPHEPSWYDYMIGKNHAKLVSVKENIKACIPRYIKSGENLPLIDVLEFQGLQAILFADEHDFAAYCNVPDDAIEESPYFKSQYRGTTGGWHHVRAMITNLVKTTSRTRWFPDNDITSESQMIMPFNHAGSDSQTGFYQYVADGASEISSAMQNFYANSVSAFTEVPLFRRVDTNNAVFYYWQKNHESEDENGVKRGYNWGFVPTYHVPDELMLGVNMVVCNADFRQFTKGYEGPLYGESYKRLFYNLKGMFQPRDTFFQYFDNETFTWCPIGNQQTMTTFQMPMVLSAASCAYEGNYFTNYTSVGTNFTVSVGYTNFSERYHVEEIYTNYTYTTNYFGSGLYETNFFEVPVKTNFYELYQFTEYPLLYPYAAIGYSYDYGQNIGIPPENRTYYYYSGMGHGRLPVYEIEKTNLAVIFETGTNFVVNMTETAMTNFYDSDYINSAPCYYTNTTASNATFELLPGTSGTAYRFGKAMVFNHELIGGFSNSASSLYTGIPHRVDTYALVTSPVTNTPVVFWRFYQTPEDNQTANHLYTIPKTESAFNSFGLDVDQGWSEKLGAETNTESYAWGKYWGPPQVTGTNAFDWLSDNGNVPFRVPPIETSFSDGWQMATNLAVIYWDFKYK